MQTLRSHIIYASRSETVRLWHLTDLHLGARACNETLLKRHIRMIADDPYARWIGGGDYLNCIARVGDKRYKESEQAEWLYGVDDVIQAQEERLAELLTPIAHKCAGLVNGNHENAANKYYGRDVYLSIIKRVAAAGEKKPEQLALGIQGFVLLTFRRQSPGSAVSGSGWTLPIFTGHGTGGGRKAGGDALFLENMMATFWARLYLFGHRHKPHVITSTITEPRASGGARTTTRLAMQSASYLQSYITTDGIPVDSYAEHLHLPATAIGATPILIDPDAQDFHVMISSAGTGIGERLPMFAAAGG